MMLYVVMCLRKSIELNDQEVKITPYNGCIGYLPVFSNRKKAEKFAGNKYPIFQGEIKKEKS